MWGKCLCTAFAAFVWAADRDAKAGAKTRAKAFPQPGVDGRRQPFSAWLERDYLENTGAFLHLGQRRPALVLALSMALLVGIKLGFLSWVGKEKPSAWENLQGAGYAFLAAGALGNVEDRLSKGYVIDYLRFRRGPARLRRIVWNLSDILIFAGTSLWLLGSRLSGYGEGA